MWPSSSWRTCTVKAVNILPPQSIVKIRERALLRPTSSEPFRRVFLMRISSATRAALIALVAFVGLSPASYADSGAVTLTIYKGGWIIGASGGSGSLYFRGRYYALSTGGLDYG